MNLVLFEDSGYRNLLPLVWLRPCFALRCGRTKLIDKVRQHFGWPIIELRVRRELAEVTRERFELDEPNRSSDICLINARTLVRGDVNPPARGGAWVHDGRLIAATLTSDEFERLGPHDLLDDERVATLIGRLKPEPTPEHVELIDYPWDLVAANGRMLELECTDGGVHEGEIYQGAHLVNPGGIRIAPGSRIKPGVVLDADTGPICIGRDVLIEPNAVIQGPCCIGDRSIIRPGTVIRGNTSIGPVCRVGGEIEDTIFQGYANKQHDGFLGHSFVCPWVNLGADTVTSDLKNTYGTVRVALNGVPVETGQHFVGSFIGDHSKTGIGTILPTGCVVGVAANVFTQHAVPKFVPSFAWLTEDGLTRYRLDKAIRIAEIVMARRDVHLTRAEADLLATVEQLAGQIESAGWQAE